MNINVNEAAFELDADVNALGVEIESLAFILEQAYQAADRAISFLDQIGRADVIQMSELKALQKYLDISLDYKEKVVYKFENVRDQAASLPTVGQDGQEKQ